jgi:hypothetical protein
MADVVNTGLKQADIPLKITPYQEGPKRTTWRLTCLNGADLQAVWKKVDKTQRAIEERCEGDPVLCSKEDALFLMASQYLLWMVEMDGRVDHPEYPMVMSVMAHWMMMYEAKGGNPKDFGDKRA